MYQGKQQFDELQAETLRKATNPVEKHKVRLRNTVRLVQYIDTMQAFSWEESLHFQWHQKRRALYVL